MKHPLRVGLLVSAGVHAAVLAALLVIRSAPSGSTPMRVRMLSPPAPAAVSGEGGPVSATHPLPSTPSRGVAAASPSLGTGAGVAGPARARARPAVPPPSEPAPSTAATTADEHPASAEEARRKPTPTPGRDAVQDDIWLLTDDAAQASPPPAPPGESSGGPAPGGPRGEVSPDVRSGPGASGSPALLGELSQRLAWSAMRCAPQGAVRSSRGGPPEVPLHFCLDAAGRPSAVDLEGTTGSELLDRAARECVVPGAAPLPPLPGCYTVAVRFPLRG